MKGEHYPNFDWLRLLFAIQVVAMHSGAWNTVFVAPVPAFLAVSGFVVMGSLERNTIARFFLNRALRVLPMLFASFLAVWAVFDWAEMVRTIIFWLYPFGPPVANSVVWSLIYEEFYYALLALLSVAGVLRYRFLSIVLAMACTYCTMRNWFFGLPSPLFLLGSAFFTGNAVYQYRESIRRINKWVALVAAVLVTMYVHTIPYTDIVQPERAGIDALSFLLILVFAVAGPQLPKLAIDLSYSLYLIHCLVRAELLGFIPMNTVRMFWIMLLTSLPISYACWYLIEAPSLRLKKVIPAWWARRRDPSLRLVPASDAARSPDGRGQASGQDYRALGGDGR